MSRVRLKSATSWWEKIFSYVFVLFFVDLSSLRLMSQTGTLFGGE